MLRIVYFLVYAALAALGEALVARPGLLWLRSQGLLHTVAAWEVPMGGAFFGLALLVAGVTTALAMALALRKRTRRPHHAAFLSLLALCMAVRAAADPPRPPADPVPSLLAGLRAAAEQLDALWTGSYAPDAGLFASAFASTPPPPFRRLCRPAPLHVRVLSGADGAQLDPLPGDQPGTIYLALSRNRSTAWLSVLGLHGIVRLPSGKAAVIEAHGGTHSVVGRDPLLPAYPRVRETAR